jgi:uncharacterized protein (DUF1778 family)
MKVDNERIWVRFTTERRDKLQEMANKVGLPLSQFVALSAWSGATFIMRALDPDFKSMVKAAEEAEMQEMIEDYENSVAIDYQEFLEWQRQKEASAQKLP